MSSISSKGFKFKNISNNIKTREAEEPRENIYCSVKNAKRDWEDAKNIFENATDPDLIDYAIYNVDAAEKKYTYLLKQIKSGSVY